MQLFSMQKVSALISLCIASMLSLSLLVGCDNQDELSYVENTTQSNVQASPAIVEFNEELANEKTTSFDLQDVPAFSGSPYVVLNDNIPQFSDEDKQRSTFEEYSPLDSLGRPGVAFALVGKDTMPTEERGSIGDVRPAGWHTVRYNTVIEGNYLYNRCHLVGYQLSGENANERNLITGTRYLNTEGMLPFENSVADYIDNTNNHVLYRVTPIYDGSNLVASGVQMEAYSIEDAGEGIAFNVYCYNVQPSIEIDYATGDSVLVSQESLETTEYSVSDYILNTNSKKFHSPNCSSVNDMKPSNKEEFHGSRSELLKDGYEPCGRCNP